MQTTLIDAPSITQATPAAPATAPAFQCTQARFGPWHLASASSTGLRHAEQGHACEDSTGHREQLHGGAVVAVGDGVSGGAAALAASAAAVAYCVATPSARFCAETLDAAVQTAVTVATYPRTQARGATTLAAAWLSAQGQGQLLHVGDCRIYHWRATHRELKALTVDETFTSLGELPPSHIPPDNPARMLGIGQMGLAGQGHSVQRQSIHLAVGDLLMLCSDGLHGFVPDRELARHVGQACMGQGWATTSCASLARLCRHLLRSALARGSDDDVSVLLLGYAPGSVPAPSLHLL